MRPIFENEALMRAVALGSAVVIVVIALLVFLFG
jgi:hypothetical protein